MTDPALVEQKRKALGATAVGRLAHAVPNIEQFLESAFERGESISRLTAQLIGLLDDYGAKELAAAVVEALERITRALLQLLSSWRDAIAHPAALSCQSICLDIPS